MAISLVIQKRLEMQGFVGCRYDPAFAQVAPWLRFTPALGMALVGLGTALAWPLLLLALIPVAVSGAILPVHPADLLYNYGLRRLTGTPPLPANPKPRRFAFGAAAVGLAVTAAAFLAGATTPGYLLGAALTLIPAINVVVSHFCLLALVYRLLLERWVGR